jgi:hypothetical protein
MQPIVASCEAAGRLASDWPGQVASDAISSSSGGTTVEVDGSLEV